MPERHTSAGREELDDLDRLFLTRLDRVPVPDDLMSRVLASTVARPEPTRPGLAWPWIVAGLAALGLLVIAGYQLGVSLAASDGLELVGAIFEDVGLLMAAPGDVLAAVGEVIPWGMVALAGVSAALLILAAGHVAPRAPESVRARTTA